MKLTIITGTSNYAECDWDELRIEGKHVYNSRPLCECPEDAILGRGLIGASEIAELMRKAYDCGKSGGEFEVEEKQDDGD